MQPWPNSLRELNNLPEVEKRRCYSTLLPEWLFTSYGVDRESLSVDGKPVVFFRWPKGSRAFELTVRLHPFDRDPLLYLNMTDTQNNQLLVLLVVINNPDSPRFDIDIDEQGRATTLGTDGRNLVAEVAAMQAGLAPGQIRMGLRVFKQAVPIFEQFVKNLGHEMFIIEPLAYHNAITFERYGFSYMRGRQRMEKIHQAFLPDGELHAKLTPDNPFRQPDYWRSVRGRSWAIHDGILGYPFSDFQMYKRIGVHAGMSTFPESIW